MSERENTGSVLTAFLLGGILGAAAGLLLAPRSGKDTRRRLQRWLDDLEGKGEGILQEGREMLAEGKEIVKDKTEGVKRAFDAGRKLWDNTIHRD